MSDLTPMEFARRSAVTAARAADDKGATDVSVLQVGPVLGICEFFVLASAANDRQVKAVVEAVEERVADEVGEKPRSVEGADGRRWVLIDYGDVVVHVFHAEEREYYRIERLYSDAPIVDWRPAGRPD
jgi:ribosome-associated protein